MRKDDRRAAVLDEAITIIGERGYRGFSINELARRCGLTTAGLLHHFGSKDGLLIALLQERDRRDREVVAGTLGLTRGLPVTREQALAALHAIIARNASQPHMVRLYAVLRAEALGSDHPASAYFAERERETMHSIREMLMPLIEDHESAALQIVALLNGLALQWLREDCSFDLVAEWDKVADKIIR